MKCVIAGGRDYIATNDDENMIIRIINHYDITEIISGHAKGADAFGEYIAKKYKLKLTLFEADWNKYGTKAGPLRNREMACYTDYVMLFPGGKGTDSMRKEARIHNKRIIYDGK